jgi:hypothetical protein
MAGVEGDSSPDEIRAALTEAAPPPIGFDVTDDVLDAPDGARVMFERVGGRWEPAEAAPPSGALDRFDCEQCWAAIRAHHPVTPEPTDDREATR